MDETLTYITAMICWVGVAIAMSFDSWVVLEQ